MLHIQLLGPVAAHVDGRAIPLGGVKQRVLLARLAISLGRPVQPEQLIEDVWESRPPKDPQHALQAHISRLRSRLGDHVDFSHGGYRLGAAEVEVDATTFQALADEGRTHLHAHRSGAAATRLRSALGLWRGPALADLGAVAGLRPFAVRLDELRRSVRADRIDAELACGDPASLVGELRELVEADPEQERAWHQLIVALAASGRRSDALDAYRGARDALIEHQGIEPSERLVRLHQALLHDEPVPGSSPHVPPAPAHRVAAAPEAGIPAEITRRVRRPFTGRKEELAALSQAWSRRGDGPQLVVLAGDPGIGKSRLAAEFAFRRADEADVLFGRCDESLRVPFQPFMEMLRREVDRWSPDELPARLGAGRGHLTDLLPELSARLPEARPRRYEDTDIERYRTFDAVADWLSTASTQTPTVLVVDDLHWADQPTLMLLEHLLHTPRRLPLLIVATYRDREHRATDPTSRLVARLVRSETAARLDLTRLPPEDVTDLFTNELTASGAASQNSRSTTEWVRQASGGNPLFVLELARHLAEHGPATAGPGVPGGIREVVHERVDRLPDGIPEILQSASVIGRTFDPHVVQVVADLDDDGLDEMLTAASYTRLIERAGDTGLDYVFTHDLVRATLYDSIPPLRRARLHRDVGETLERRHLTDLEAHYGELAHHFSEAAEAGLGTEAVQYLELAGRAACDQGASAIAVQHYSRALELLTCEEDPGKYCDLMTACGLAEFQAGHSSYRETLLASAQIALDTGDTPRLAAAAVANARGWWTGSAGTDEERLTTLEAALASVGDQDPDTRAKLLTARAVERVRDPTRHEEAIADSRHAVRLARQHGDPALLALALSEHYAVCYASFADRHDCLAITTELMDLAHRSGDLVLEISATVSHCQATAAVGDIVTSDRLLARAEQTLRGLHQPSRLWMVRTWSAMRHALHGDLDAAEHRAVAAFELGAASGQPEAATWFAGQLFTLRWLAGRLPELLGDIEQQVHEQSADLPAWRAAYALALAESGHTDEAEVILDGFVGHGGVDLPRTMLWPHAMAYLAGVCARVDRPDAAELLYDELLPYSGMLIDNGTLGTGPLDLHLGLLAQRSRPEVVPVGAAHRHLADAARLCQRIDAPLWLQRVQSARTTGPAAQR